MDEIVPVLALLGVVAFLVAVIGYVVLLRRGITRRHLAGPGHAGVPAPTDPYQRFCGALAAPYARYEWVLTRAHAGISAEQTYTGFGAVGSPVALQGALTRDWGVKDSATAQVEIGEGVLAVLLGTRELLVSGPGRDPGTEGERLLRAGVPSTAVGAVGLEASAALRAQGVPLADDVEELGDRLAFDIGRFANLLRWSASAGHVDAAYARSASDLFGACAVIAFDDFSDYGVHYRDGLLASRFRANDVRVAVIDWLLTDPESPWQTERWPQAV